MTVAPFDDANSIKVSHSCHEALSDIYDKMCKSCTGEIRWHTAMFLALL